MKLRIFVIDDEEAILESFRWHLEDQGHEVHVATEPELCDVYHGCDCSSPYPCGDLLFIDYSMPRMSGLEFIKLMHQRGCKGNPANKYLMSGNISTIDMDIVKKIGCNVLQKPVTLDEIDHIVETVIKRTPETRKLVDLNMSGNRTSNDNPGR